MIPLLAVLAVVACMGNEILMERKGNLQILSVLTIVVSLLIVVPLMRIISARVYTFAILILSDLEKGNTDGYHALYWSMGAAGLFAAGLISNLIAGFVKARSADGSKYLLPPTSWDNLQDKLIKCNSSHNYVESRKKYLDRKSKSRIIAYVNSL